MALSGLQFEISAGEHSATIVEVGAGLRRYSHAGAEVVPTYGDDELPPKGCGAVLVPWPNRLGGGSYAFEGKKYQVPITEVARGNANHGFGRWARWAPVAQNESSIALMLDIPPQTGWPFEIRVVVTYAVHAQFGLAVTTTALNTGRSAAPFGAGFHPYLSTRGHALSAVTVRAPASTYLVVDEAQLPIDEKPVEGTRFDLRSGLELGDERFDDAWGGLSYESGRGVATVLTPSGGAALWFDEAFKYLQIYTVDDLAHGEPAVAVEPMSCPGNAFNTGTGLVVLQPGQIWNGAWGITPQ